MPTYLRQYTDVAEIHFGSQLATLNLTLLTSREAAGEALDLFQRILSEWPVRDGDDNDQD
ncbi:hypothetical protein [Amycolatopsis sp. cmx-8-4]|uniref:hypothetical protein n=1 Tax=Amycolatopsis sp. cmx-8-4 TaxID=2790947 RepID=UPI00397E483B